jgi:hypothetical protein
MGNTARRRCISHCVIRAVKEASEDDQKARIAAELIL